MYAHVSGGVVDSVGRPPSIIRLGGSWCEFVTLDPSDLESVGWYLVIESPRPPDTASETSNDSYEFNGLSVVQVWIVRAKTSEELADDLRAANYRTIAERATIALADNRTFLAIDAPTNAQALAQIRSLTRQNNGLIRLALSMLDGSD